MILYRVKHNLGRLSARSVVKENKIVTAIERRKRLADPGNWEIRHDFSLVLFQLLVDGLRIISKGCLELGILAEVAVLLHVDVVANLCQFGSFLGERLDLRKQIMEIIAKLLEFDLGAQFEVAGYYCLQRLVQHCVQSPNPIFGAAVVHRGGGPVKKQVSHRDGTLTGEIHQRISRSVGFARKINLGGVRIEMDRKALLKCHGGGPEPR